MRLLRPPPLTPLTPLLSAILLISVLSQRHLLPLSSATLLSVDSDAPTCTNISFSILHPHDAAVKFSPGVVGVVLSHLTGDGSCSNQSFAFVLHSEADPRLSSVFTAASWTSSTVLNNAVLCLEPGEHVITVTLHALTVSPGQTPDRSVHVIDTGEILASRTVGFHMLPNTPPPLHPGPVLALVDYEKHLCSQPLGCMCTPHDLFGHWHNDMSHVFWTRDLSFSWLETRDRKLSQQSIVVYVYGGVINRAEAWLKSASSTPPSADDAAFILNGSKSHVAMSFESPDPFISRAFSAAAAQAAGAFDLFMSCDRKVMEALPPQKAMFMSCGWAEGSPPVKEWGFTASDKTNLVSMQASTSNFTSGHRIRLQASELLKDRVHRFGRGYAMYNSPAEYLKAFYFSVVIENIRADFYFSSKLINCFVHGVVPIYWGAPSIADFFNISGIIEFETVQQLDDIVAGLTIEKWLGMLPAIQDNLNRAKRYGNDWDFQFTHLLPQMSSRLDQSN